MMKFGIASVDETVNAHHQPALVGRQAASVQPCGLVPQEGSPSPTSLKTSPKVNQRTSLYHKIPGSEFVERSVSVKYFREPSLVTGGRTGLLTTVLERTPKAKGKDCFSSVHVVCAPGPSSESVAECLSEDAQVLGMPIEQYKLPEEAMSGDPMHEWTAIFEVASSLILNKADRASLVVYVGGDDARADAFAAFIGMLPFRGLATALLSQHAGYADTARCATPSTVFEVDSEQAARMGMYPLSSVFGPLDDKTIELPVSAWHPIEPPKQNNTPDKHDIVVHLPFKIGGLRLPMATNKAPYAEAVASFGETLHSHYVAEGHPDFVPIVSCGESCDALGYGADVLSALQQPDGFLFTHRSGETYKRFDNYGTPELFAHIAKAKASARPVVIVAVGGGVNGNCIGLVAALTGVDFVEVPTTPMHYNDATTSAKKAFSLIQDDVILSKNILGAFYLPRLVFCVNEMFLTCSAANVHATVGESCKTMNMLGVANSAVGANDYHNILGGAEFASDFTKIVNTVGGFDALLDFVHSPETAELKERIMCIGREIRKILSLETSAGAPSRSTHTLHQDDPEGGQRAAATVTMSSAPMVHSDLLVDRVTCLEMERVSLMNTYRGHYEALSSHSKLSIQEFLTTVNMEVVAAKAMFLAYADPFEKYRALLFEYAHTLGHGIEAFANTLYQRAAAKKMEVPANAFRLHGQCVGMAVLWAGAMSAKLRVLNGTGLQLHQSLVYLFNRHGGFCFQPLRQLCEELGVSCAEMVNGVIAVVRRDNKKGYCKCGENSVDQLVAGRPGKMLRSLDPAAELRYLVEVDESLQREMLTRAFAGEFDRVADLRDGELVFVPYGERLITSSTEVAAYIHTSIKALYSTELEEGEEMCQMCPVE